MKKTAPILAALSLLGCASSADTTLEGKVAVKGSMPHTYLVIEDKATHKDYRIVNPKDFNLINMQNKIVKIKAEVVKKAIGPGFPAEIKVIEAE